MLDLASDVVHVWLVRVQAGVDDAHRGLRLVLARYLDESPDALGFATQPGGKPMLSRPTSVRFNLSHSGNLAAVAVAQGREVGVDVERRRPLHREAGVARRIMTDGEHARYASLPPPERADFLLWAWARKEALVKAAGTGISGSSLRQVPCEPAAHDPFGVHDLDVPGYAAAVAAEGHGWRPVVLVLDLGPTG